METAVNFFIGFPGGSVVKNPSAKQEMGSISGLEDPLDEGMTNHSIFLLGESHPQRNLESYSP